MRSLIIRLSILLGMLFPALVSAGTVVEFYNTNLDNYFITADSNEATQIDNGSAGPGWSRTGNSFESGGSTSVCRFYGSYSPGPNSHFYTVDQGECQALKDQQIPTGNSRKLTEKSWNFESLDFVSTPPANGTCPAGSTPVYRAYNNGYSRGVDSNHRITSSLTAIQEVVNRGWSNEGVVMCAPPIIPLGPIMESEYNDSSAYANQAFFNRDIQGSLSNTGDQDWFYFDVTTTNGYINVNFDVSSMASGSWSVYWYSPNMSVMSGRNISPPSFGYNFPAFTAGRYYLRVMPSMSVLYNGGTYTVRAYPSP